MDFWDIGSAGGRAPSGFRGEARRMEPEAVAAAAAALGVESAALQAVAEVESRHAPFLASGRPVILFERHVFRRLTGGAHDARPDLSHPEAGGYGAGGEAQHARLARAVALDRAAALRATSWGRFQVLGLNAELCGWPDVESFVADHCADEAAHLAGFVGYVRGAGLAGALAARDWAGFARGYNGPAYARNRYDARMAAAYARLTSPGVFRVEGVAELQRALAFLGAEPGPADGAMGPMTEAAIRRFERRCRLAETGLASAAVRAAAQAAYYALGGDPAA